MTFNSIEIYQRSKKPIIYKLIRSDPTRFLPENQTDPTRMIRTRTQPVRSPPLIFTSLRLGDTDTQQFFSYFSFTFLLVSGIPIHNKESRVKKEERFLSNAELCK
jgi:hypothetical protein